MTPKELRKLRQHAKLTQEQLGALIGKDRMTVNRWENGKIKIDQLAEIAIRAVIRAWLERKPPG